MSFEDSELALLIDLARDSIGEQQAYATSILNQAPPITRAGLWFWEAYQHLNADRSSGMATGGIPFVAMRAYASEYGLKGHEREAFFHILRLVDNHHVNLLNAKRRKADEQSK
ncbi:hypothetical protein QH494_02495 [Sphingomonas sp. AR_OL41]|uniref:phage tail assembly chaperone n=1 Tax=Sphingomonas sp. AR_OL41 TaxID=3042729 RepID=UPI002480F837|nr:hypothetical protein [Sphingomonas sp. AR_OL41]MDH7971038.1 hypothetical protein [Sphingomonas sp. AR_OL41]